MDRSRTLKAFAVSSNLLGIIAALILSAEALGAPDAVLVAIASVLLVALTSGVGLWYVSRRMRTQYLEAAKASYHAQELADARAKAAMYSDPDLLRREIVPAFRDAGLVRSRDSFLSLVESLQLDAEATSREREFIEMTVKDPALRDQEKIDRLVSHFAPSLEATEEEGGHGSSNP